MKKIDRILLLGSSGQIGSSLKKKLKEVGKKIICLSKKKLNLENKSLIKKILNKTRPSLIINAAAYTKVDEAEVNKKLCYKINVLSTKEIADWAYKNNSFLVHYSTVYIFSGKKKNSWSENDKPNPVNFYGKSKLKAEKKIILSKCNYLILRLNWIYSDKGNSFPRKIIEKIIKENKVSVVNNQIGTPNHAEFISNITIKILRKIINNYAINPKILNVSANGRINYYKFAKKIQQILSPKYRSCSLIPINAENFKKISIHNKTAKRPLNSLLNIQKLENFLNLKMPNWEIMFKNKINQLIKNCLK